MRVASYTSVGIYEGGTVVDKYMLYGPNHSAQFTINAVLFSITSTLIFSVLCN